MNENKKTIDTKEFRDLLHAYRNSTTDFAERKAELIAHIDAHLASSSDKPVATVTISHFRNCPGMENVDFQMETDLPDGTHKLYLAPTESSVSEADERAMFEAARQRIAEHVYDMRLSDAESEDRALFLLWKDGQARAALAHSASSAKAEPIYATGGIEDIADELEAEALNYEGDFADTVKGCAEALREIAARPTATPASAQPADDQAALDAQLRQEVATMYQLLDDGEWAEHVAVTPHGQCLETAITRLVGKAIAQPVAAAPEGIDWIYAVVRDVAKLDRGSPEDEPDMMLVTSDELFSIVRRHAPAAPVAQAEANAGCRYPLCQSEEEQDRIAAEVHQQLYSGELTPAPVAPQGAQGEPFTAAELDEIEAVAVAAPATWYGTYQIIDGISDEKSVELIEACSPDTVVSLVRMARAATAQQAEAPSQASQQEGA